MNTDRPNLLDVFLKLPLFDNLYLAMQARNVALIDIHLQDLEADLLREYFQEDRTPHPSMMLVSALSQFWIFGVYELLRTWKQQVEELIAYDDELSNIRGDPNFESKKDALFQRRKLKAIPLKVSEDFVEAMYGENFRKIETDSKFTFKLKYSKDLVIPVFRRIAELRMALAKHEVQGTRGVRTFAPGYARIDTVSGTLCWMVEKRDGSSDIVSRKVLTEDLLSLLSNLNNHPSYSAS